MRRHFIPHLRLASIASSLSIEDARHDNRLFSGHGIIAAIADASNEYCSIDARWVEPIIDKFDRAFVSAPFIAIYGIGFR